MLSVQNVLDVFRGMKFWVWFDQKFDSTLLFDIVDLDRQDELDYLHKVIELWLQLEDFEKDQAVKLYPKAMTRAQVDLAWDLIGFLWNGLTRETPIFNQHFEKLLLHYRREENPIRIWDCADEEDRIQLVQIFLTSEE